MIPQLIGDAAFEPGTLIEAGPVILSTGGAVSNTGISLAKLGVRTALVGKVGSGIFGRAVIELIEGQGKGLAKWMAVDEGQPTSYTIVLNPVGRDRTFIHAPGANESFCSADVPDELLRQVRWMHLGYPPLLRRMYMSEGEELVDIFRRAKAAGATTSLDLSLPDPNSESGRIDWKKILSRVLPFVDYFLPSDEELLYMLDREAFNSRPPGPISATTLLDLIDRSCQLGAANVAIKLGERGLLFRAGPGSPDWSGKTIWHPCYQVEVAGTTGAGDATIAGFIPGALRCLDPVGIAQTAVAAGACCCEAADAVGGARSWSEIQARIDKGWATVPLALGDEWEPVGSAFVRK